MTWFLNLRLAAKLSVSFLICALITVAIGLVGMNGNSRLGDMISSVFSNNITSINKVNEALQQIIYHNRDLYLLLSQKAGNAPESELAATQKSISDRQAAVEKSFATYRSTPQREDEKALSDKFDIDWPSYIKAGEKYINLVRAGDLPQARLALAGDVTEKYSAAEKEMLGIIASNNDQADDQQIASESLIQSSKITLLLGMVIAFVLAMGLGLLITRLITRPLAYAVSAAERVAGGDLTQRIEPGSQDETGQLLSSLAEMQTSLRNTIQNISSASDQLASAAEELSVVTDESTRGLTQQNSEIEQAATAVNEMTAAVDEVARNAVSTAEISQRTNQDAISGKSKVGEAVLAIEDMVGEINSSSSQVQELAHQTKEISKVLEVIRSIADQTNLLALNAAIEAARAGEQGRGFAVVADEVRKLAEQSQEAAGRIASLIGEIQGETGRAVEAMNKGTAEVKEGTVVAGQAGAAFEEIVGLIRKANEEVAAITTAIEQTVNGSGRIVHAVDDMQRVSRDTAEQTQTVAAATEEQAASMEEIASSSRSLAHLAEELQVAVSRFKV